MRRTLAVLAVVMLVACGKKEDFRPRPSSDIGVKSNTTGPIRLKCEIER